MKTAHFALKTHTASPSFSRLSGELLSLGLGVRFRAPGTSMHPTIRHGDVIIVGPVAPDHLERGDIILYRLRSRLIAHRIMNIEERGDCGLTFILQGDASTSCDAPVEPQQILGKVVRVERGRRSIDPYGWRVRLWSMVHLWLGRCRRVVFRWSIREQAHKSPPFVKGDLGGFWGASEIPPDPPLAKGGN